MSRKFGVVFDEQIAQKVEEPLEYGESRSSRVEMLTAVGLEVERQVNKHDISAQNKHELRAIVRQAFHEYREQVADIEAKSREE